MSESSNNTDRNEQIDSMFKQAEAFTGPQVPDEKSQKKSPFGCGIFMLILILAIIAFFAVVLTQTGNCGGA